MEYNTMSQGNTSNPFTNDLAWDLRQFYTRFVSLHMMDFYRAQSQRNYPLWLRALDMWHASISHKIKKKERKGKKTDQEETYSSLRNEIVEIAIENRPTYLGKAFKDEVVEKLESIFRKMESLLLKEMDDNNMFGGKREVTGL